MATASILPAAFFSIVMSVSIPIPDTPSQHMISTVTYCAQRCKHQKYQQMFPWLICYVQCPFLPSSGFRRDPADETRAEYTLKAQTRRDKQQQNTDDRIHDRVDRSFYFIKSDHLNAHASLLVRRLCSAVKPSVKYINAQTASEPARFSSRRSAADVALRSA